MSKVEVVVATMNQEDVSLYKKMNIHSDMVIANQAQTDSFLEKVEDGFQIKMITTSGKGVGKNRNVGLAYADSEILMLADDDIVYHDGYEQMISRAFEELSEADVIIFRMQFIKNGKVYEIDKHHTRRLHIWNGLSFGTYQIAIKRKSLERANIHFTHLFGGGCIYSAGEDSIFLIDCFRKGLKVYSYAGLLGDNIRESSSWFKGYNRKFFFDRGALAAGGFSKFKYLMCLHYVIVYRKKTDIPNIEKLKLMIAGAKGYSNLMTYEDWEMKRH